MDVAAFIAANVRPTDEDLDLPASPESESPRLSPPTAKTRALWAQCTALLRQEYDKGGVLAVDTSRMSNITSHAPGYIDGDGTLDNVVVVRGAKCV